MRRTLLVVILVASIGALAGSTASTRPALAASCDPIQTPPSFLGQAPTAQTVLGFGLGSQEVTAAEADRYVQAVDAASPRVVSGVLATSWEGRPLRYALVGTPEHVTPAGLAAIRAATQRLRDPATPPAEAARLAADTPAILWLMGNVHGGEESGTDAQLRVLYELADRTDCAATQILDNALVGIIPTQNPDGREAEQRQNAYFFDMNRDWFARTQPETDGKLELLRQYPGVMHIDAHEMGGNHFFFPPAADPIYHEVTEESVALHRRPVRRRDAGRVRPAAHPVLQRQGLRLLRDGLRRHRPVRRIRQRRDDVREGELPPDRRTDVRAVRRPLGVALRGGARTASGCCSTGTARGSTP